jgi:hypothetical protein
MSSLLLSLRVKASQVPRDLAVAGAVCFVTATGLLLDAMATLPVQKGLGVLAWLVLLGLLRGEGWHVRIQTAIVIGIATAAEYLFSPHWHFYTYRFENVPLYVSPGHGMVYLAAAALGRSEFFRRHHALLTYAALLGGTAWAAWGLFFAERGDVGGALLFALLFVFILIGRTHPLYVAAFFITTYLEFVGTYYGNWAWAPQWPFFGFSQANPPCGISAGYCIFDAIAVLGWALLERSWLAGCRAWAWLFARPAASSLAAEQPAAAAVAYADEPLAENAGAG